jgi:hypothetical protein
MGVSTPGNRSSERRALKLKGLLQTERASNVEVGIGLSG